MPQSGILIITEGLRKSDIYLCLLRFPWDVLLRYTSIYKNKSTLEISHTKGEEDKPEAYRVRHLVLNIFAAETSNNADNAKCHGDHRHYAG